MKKPYVTHNEKMEETRQQRHRLRNTPSDAHGQEANQAEIDKMNMLAFQILGADEGAKLFKYVEARLVGNTMIKKGPEGRVDQHATLIANGAYEVFNYIRQMINYGAISK